MKIRTEKILDSLFVSYLLAAIVIPTSIIGKIIQVFFLIAVVLLLGVKRLKITKYNVADFLFFLFTIFQLIFSIAVIKSGSLGASKTIFYNFVFSIVIISYLVYKKDLTSFSYIYAKTTAFSLVFLLIIYGINSHSIRFNTSNTIYFIGGHSTTSLSIIAAMPVIFLILFGKRKDFKKNILLSTLLLMLSILTGTRKTLILFALIYFIIIPLRYKRINYVETFKRIGVAVVMILLSLFLCFKVPALYELLGNRLEGFIQSLNSETENITDDSIRVRERMENKAEYLFTQRKTTGWGMDYFRASSQNEMGYYSHNNFLEILVGGGIIGFILYYSKYVILFISLIMIKKKNKKLCLFMTWFLISMIIIELWQVTYIYRFIMIYQSIIVAILYRLKNNMPLGSEEFS